MIQQFNKNKIQQHETQVQWHIWWFTTIYNKVYNTSTCNYYKNNSKVQQRHNRK